MNKKEILAQADFSSVVHNDEINQELIRWGKANGYPIDRAKFSKALDGYAGFAPAYVILAKKQPPIPGGWHVTVESFTPETREVFIEAEGYKDAQGKTAYRINRVMAAMLEEYGQEGLRLEIGQKVVADYGYMTFVAKATGHPLLLDNLEEFLNNLG